MARRHLEASSETGTTLTPVRPIVGHPGPRTEPRQRAVHLVVAAGVTVTLACGAVGVKQPETMFIPQAIAMPAIKLFKSRTAVR